MRMIWILARREYSAHVRTRGFLFGLILTPLFLGGIFLVPVSTSRGSLPVVPLAVVDATGRNLITSLETHLQTAVSRLPGSRPVQIAPRGRFVCPAPRRAATRAAAERLVEEGAAAAVLILPAGWAEGARPVLSIPRGDPGHDAQAVLALALEGLFREQQLEALALDAPVAQRILRPPPYRVERPADASAGGSGLGAFLAPLVFVIFLFVAILGMSHSCLTSVIEEKSSRVVEMLLSSVTPTQLMGGKILGLGLVGLTLVSLWLAGGAALAAWRDAQWLLPLPLCAYFLLFFLLGFLFFAALLAGIGSAVGSLKEAQHLVAPVTVFLSIPLVAWYSVTQMPHGLLARVLSYVPFTAPLVMMNRLAAEPPPSPAETLLVTAVLAGWVVLAIWLAGRVFRAGLLLQSGPASVATMLRWILRG